MNNKVLIFGKNAFVASGIEEILLSEGYDVDLFTRGEARKTSNVIYGQIDKILKNRFFQPKYDFIINYILLKGDTLDKNIFFIQNLLDFCLKHKVKKLIHFSSIMVYDYTEKYVDENTKIEPSIKTSKKGYGEIKIAVDEYLLSMKSQYPFEIILVRPGYVLDDNRDLPFVKNLPFGFSMIKGNRDSKQPIVRKDTIHKAIIQILLIKDNLLVYHFFSNKNMTKYQIIKEIFGSKILLMPEFVFRKIPAFLLKIKFFPKSLYSRFEGMYIKTEYSSKMTEEKLNIKF